MNYLCSYVFPCSSRSSPVSALQVQHKGISSLPFSWKMLNLGRCFDNYCFTLTNTDVRSDSKGNGVSTNSGLVWSARNCELAAVPFDQSVNTTYVELLQKCGVHILHTTHSSINEYAHETEGDKCNHAYVVNGRHVDVLLNALLPIKLAPVDYHHLWPDAYRVGPRIFGQVVSCLVYLYHLLMDNYISF